MKLIITISSLFFAISTLAQDIIVKNDKSEIKAKVLEITDTSIKYKKFEMQEGPTYNINKNEVFMIIYKSGLKEYIDNSTENGSKTSSPVLQASKRSLNNENLSFGLKTKTLHAGIGFGSGAFAGEGGTMVIPPLQIRYEFAVSPKISTGAVFGIASNEFNFSGSIETYTYLLFGAVGNYHFATGEKFDPYFGPFLGYNSISASVGSVSVGEVFFGGQLGANYYFSKSIGAWAQVGYGIGNINVGITFKLNKQNQ